MNIIRTFFAFIRKFWISIVFCIAIIVLCFMSAQSLPRVSISNLDKFVHYLMFWGLSGAVFFDNTYYLRQATSVQRIFWGSFLFPVLMGGLIEILQGVLTSYRFGDWWDFFYDVVGAVIGFLICLLINCWLKPAINK